MEVKNQSLGDEGDAVLIAFVEEGARADLADWMGRHPRHARDLARLAAERWAGEPAGSPADPGAEARIREIGLACFRAARPAGALASLTAAARERGLEPADVAGRLGLPVTYFWKLHRRLFAWDSLPRTFVAALAETLGRGVEEMSAYLQRPPMLAAAARYRSDSAPRAGGGEDFVATLQGDPEVAETERARWLGGK